MILEITEVDSPIGTLSLLVRDGALCAVRFDDREKPTHRWIAPAEARRADDPAGVVSRFRAYFRGDLEALDDIRVETTGTPFQCKVWSELRNVRVGQTISYGDLARMIGSPAAVRAVGAANGANPVAIVVPCHRVIGADGRLTGYGGGLDRKRWLLEHERVLLSC